MTAPGPTDLDQVLHLEMTRGWTRRERVRILWYRPRLTVLEINYATRWMVELDALALTPLRARADWIPKIWPPGREGHPR
jgi:hypothetical protein